MDENKIKYGLKNVHYAPVTSAAGVITYGTPVPIPGAVSLVANTKGDKVEFYADDTAYFVAESNQGYEGSMEFALIPDAFKKAVLGYKEDTNGVLFEDANAISKEIAILFEFQGDKKATRHVFYHVNVGRSNIEGTTKGNSIDIKPETLPITASPAPDTGYVKAKAEAGSTQYTAWYDAVYRFVAGE